MFVKGVPENKASICSEIWQAALLLRQQDKIFSKFWNNVLIKMCIFNNDKSMEETIGQLVLYQVWTKYSKKWCIKAIVFHGEGFWHSRLWQFGIKNKQKFRHFIDFIEDNLIDQKQSTVINEHFSSFGNWCKGTTRLSASYSWFAVLVTLYFLAIYNINGIPKYKDGAYWYNTVGRWYICIIEFFCLFVSLLSHFWLIHFFSPTPALSTIF